MKAIRYAHSAILLLFGAIALIFGSFELYRALSADEFRRIALENALGGGNGPEIFGLKFVGIGLLALVFGWFDWHWTTKRNGRRPV